MEESVGFVIHGTEFSDKKPMHQKGAVRLLSTVAPLVYSCAPPKSCPESFSTPVDPCTPPFDVRNAFLLNLVIILTSFCLRTHPVLRVRRASRYCGTRNR